MPCLITEDENHPLTCGVPGVPDVPDQVWPGVVLTPGPGRSRVSDMELIRVASAEHGTVSA